jgi:hypothetical protein
MTVNNASLTDAPAASAASPGLPQIGEMLSAPFTSLKGLSGSGTMSSRGIRKAMVIKPPPGAGGKAAQTPQESLNELFSVAPILPVEAIGPGAKWEVKTTASAKGLSADSTIGYELISVEGDRISCKCTLAEGTNPAPSGGKTEAPTMTMTTRGSGMVTLDVGRILPEEGTFDTHTDMVMGGQNQAMNMKWDMNLHLQAK